MLYPPLDTTQNQIRLLHLHPASDQEDEIRCHFTYVSLDEKPAYEALSYVWGTLEDLRLILIEEVGSREVTPNLYSALKHLRLIDTERTLWIDAVCIDQTDIVEKSHQVAMMGAIYRQAALVVVWLGESWDASEIAMTFLEETARTRTYTWMTREV